ncbi:pilus assembly protein PilM [Polynucleobacter sp. AP-Kolm-20A-A1]|uniref:pilus assembly protein PilM n=1 Tax=Polynucleobacter sp. AP-Kolm-20A-A1 TaxID=2081041 RepID=UPI001BFE0EA7|nr:pilus assembly protein PilM [Polynucleobacter sp. AP-Kolm-20A-A1]QWE21460.1 pilus assembly protein PilM [Polynucleobacter sp. AP-Kolm-20A-A1]
MNNPFQPILKALIDALSKYSIKQEEVVGVDITPNYIRVAQLTENADGWLLEKLGYKQVSDKASLLDIRDSQDDYVQKLRELISSANLETANAAISIPITSAIVRTVTMPLMSDEEIESAIQYDSLWNNILQLEEKLDEYSIFWQVIRRNTAENTMELLFVASKLSEINQYVQIATKAGLNPVVVDVRCFAIRNALKAHKLNAHGTTALIEFGPNENYVLIVTNDTPFIYDVYISESDRALIEAGELEGEQGDRLYDRFAGQILQAFRAYEIKLGKNLIDQVLLVSPMQNKTELLSQMRKALDGYQIDLFDPLNDLQIPSNLDEVIESEANASVFTSAIGLAVRKVDIFGYYKYVTGVNNVNLLPNRDVVRQIERKKILSKVGIFASALVVLLFVIGTLLYQYFFNNSLSGQYQTAVLIEKQIDAKEASISALKAQRSKYAQMLDASKEFKSNQVSNYQLLSAVNQVVPGGIWFTTINFDSPNSLIIKGEASNDQAIGVFIDRLQGLPMIERASLQNMTMNAAPIQRKGGGAKQFEVRCIVTNGMAPANPSQSTRPVAAPINPRPSGPAVFI